jgi:GNAT superfamily N-acetyltransferase
MEIVIVRRLVTAQEFLALRKLVGWPVFPLETVERGLTGSLFGVCAMHEDKVIGMARVLGDCAIYFHIQDVVVDPAYQRQGVGRMMIAALMEYVEKHATRNSQVGLMCSKGREPFYEEFGFKRRPSETHGAGMMKVI